MAFENPFIKPSATRKSALQYLWSDEPTSSVQQAPSSSASFVDNFTNPTNASNTIGAIAVNILNNGGEYNANQGIDASKPVDPFDVLKAFEKYGSTIKGVASTFGLGGFASIAQQQASNDLLGQMKDAFGGDVTDPSNTTLSTIGAILGVLGLPLAGFISGANKDAIAAAQGFVSNFDDKTQMQGYISAGKETADLAKEGYDTTGFISSIAGNLAGDDVAKFGEKAYQLQQDINKGLSSGKDLGQVQQSLLDKYITPDTKLTYAIPAAVYSPALATATELGKLQESNKSLEQALADMQTGVAGQINTQGEQFQTLLDQYKELGMTQNEAIQQTINDLKTDLGSQIGDVKSQVGSLNYATPDDIVNALAELNYVTPDDMAATLEGLDFTTPEDVTNQLAEAGFASTDDISNAIAGLNIPSVEDIQNAYTTPVQETPLSPVTEIPPMYEYPFVDKLGDYIYANPSDVGPQLPSDGLLTGTPDYGSIDDFGGAGAPVDTGIISGMFADVLTPAPAPAPTPSTESTVTTPSAPTGGYVTDGSGNMITSGDGTAVTWGTGAPSYTPTANEQSFASTDGYTADVPSASAGGYDPTSGYDSDTDSGGSSGGGGKIVCTAMNEAYGFGSFRNKIWLAYSAKHLSKEHEKGYHALFLPLVDIAYHKQTIASKPLRAVLENIARHRSADLRAEMRGTKRDTLGRAYRAILEPLCYFVGKYK